MRWLAAAALIVAASAAAPAPSVQAIFEQSFRRLQSYPVPPYAIWTATWNITAHPMGYYTGETKSLEVHRYAVRLSDGAENVSDPQANGKLPPALILPEFLGPFAWRLRTSVHAPALAGAVNMLPDIEGLATIAHVVAIAQPIYKIDRGNDAPPPEERLDGRPAYHLQFEPLDHPRTHNLRDLWIDAQTYDVLRAHFVGTYAPVPKAPVSDTDVTVSFSKVLDCWVVTHSVWTYDDPPISYRFDVTNDELALPPQLPDWLFDQAQYDARAAAGEPDYLGVLLSQMRRAP